MKKEKYYLKSDKTFINVNKLESLEMPPKKVIHDHVKGEFSLFKKDKRYKFKPISILMNGFRFNKLFKEISKKIKTKNTDKFYVHSDTQNPPIIEFINVEAVDK